MVLDKLIKTRLSFEEKSYFDALHKDRADSADTFEKPSTREMWRSIVEKYSDQAHFIYELIQNADDAGATSARFVLEKDRLIFAHNGVRHFSISNPQNEDMDSREGRLGDINAITGIAFSNKKDQENKIGKFGVGFKAVFQYTATPFIYDPKFRFRIDRYIVPTIIDRDFSDRSPEETLFVFPFNHPDRIPEETYTDIESKLKALTYPILFLSNLKEITYETENASGKYGKETIETIEYYDGTVAEKTSVFQGKNGTTITERLWLFTRIYNGLKYSVGFRIDESEKILPIDQPAFCFFPTKETTNLNFILHGPFLLTDSREGIKAGEEHNKILIKLLAQLSADAIVYLVGISEEKNIRIINDNIFSVIPVDPKVFVEENSVRSISFKPFFDSIKQSFMLQKIIPTHNGYTTKSNAYWASVSYLTELFDDVQLQQIVGNNEAHWAFPSIGSEEILRSNKSMFSYIESITNMTINEQQLIRGKYVMFSSKKKEFDGITTEFIEKQSIEWLKKFYKWLSETTYRTNLVKTLPVFLDQDLHAAAAFTENGNHLVLFLPSQDITGYRTIHKDIIAEPELLDFVKKLGITHPSLADQIYNVIIPQYTSGQPINSIDHFKLFFKHYLECSQSEAASLISEIKNLEFLCCRDLSGKTSLKKPCDVYYPSDELTEYFSTKPATWFWDREAYSRIPTIINNAKLSQFLDTLGIRRTVSILSKQLSKDEETQRTDLPRPTYTRSRIYIEKYIDGCEELLKYIETKKSIEKSVVLWRLLNRIAEKSGYGGIDNLLRGECKFFYTRDRIKQFDSSIVSLLKNSKWIVSRDGHFVSPQEASVVSISEKYEMFENTSQIVLDFLHIGEEIPEDDNSNLTDSQRIKIELADFASALGISPERVKELLKEEAERKTRLIETIPQSKPDIVEAQQQPSTNDSYTEKSSLPETSTQIIEDITFDLPEDTNVKISKHASNVAKDILSRTQKPVQTSDAPKKPETEEEKDSDEYTPALIDYSKKVEQEKEKAAKAIEKIVYQEELQQKALENDKYSFGWVKTLLELETVGSNDANANNHEVSISFGRVEREPGTQRTLVLKQPSRSIPQFMEDLSDIALELHYAGRTKTLAIEVANIKSYTLRVKLKPHVDISDIDFSQVTEARIDAQSPVFIMEELRKNFEGLQFEDNYNLQQNLCENIEFIFGPPGTGKTTHLARNVIVPLVEAESRLKVLVLTPTNKSADVLTRRIMEIQGKDTSYNDWLVRFGGTGDEVIEQSPVYHDKTLDIRTMQKCVTVTTIARFPYDFFMPQGARLFLSSINWNYIIIDEASMIPLANILYPLYKKTPRKFIIAGDPFQIAPIASVDLWKDENIYTMVQLDSFDNPHTIPHDYKVTLLTTQYRSTPAVGSVFSQFAYGGILKHYRSESDTRKLNINSEIKIDHLNLIKFPVSKYESIYRPKRLNHSSSYQIYSALFTFEFSAYLARKIAAANRGKFFRIGIIAPYRAQADLIEKLVGSEKLPPEVDIQIGTIHSFQGDECDIIFAIFNTPPSISNSKEMFLNKRNIINVSISRARDYLFVVMPDDNTANIENLYLVKKVEELIKSSNSFTEYNTPELEQIMFGSKTYLEENAFSTGHQSVNVYGLPEKCYEIRSEDAALDVQIHRPLRDTQIKTTHKNPPPVVRPTNKPAVPNNTQERVFNSTYGEGIVVKRSFSGGKKLVKVQFEKISLTFDEDIAFSKGALKRI